MGVTLLALFSKKSQIYILYQTISVNNHEKLQSCPLVVR